VKKLRPELRNDFIQLVWALDQLGVLNKVVDTLQVVVLQDRKLMASTLRHLAH